MIRYPLLHLLSVAADEFKAFYARLPQSYFLNVSSIQHLWSMDNLFQWRYEQLENSMRVLSRRAQRVIFKLFSLSKRCHRQPQVRLPRERWAQLLKHTCMLTVYVLFDKAALYFSQGYLWSCCSQHFYKAMSLCNVFLSLYILPVLFDVYLMRCSHFFCPKLLYIESQPAVHSID